MSSPREEVPGEILSTTLRYGQCLLVPDDFEGDVYIKTAAGRPILSAQVNTVNGIRYLARPGKDDLAFGLPYMLNVRDETQEHSPPYAFLTLPKTGFWTIKSYSDTGIRVSTERRSLEPEAPTLSEEHLKTPRLSTRGKVALVLLGLATGGALLGKSCSDDKEPSAPSAETVNN